VKVRALGMGDIKGNELLNRPEPILVIEAGKTEKQYFKDLWNYRELFLFLSWRDVLVRYKQTVFGVLWAILRPFLTMIIFTFVFGRLAKMDSGGAPYPLLVFAAMLPWQFFSSAFSEASNSLILNSNLLTKIYFPRLVVPTASVIVALVDFFISLVILVAMMFYYRYVPGLSVLSIPFLTLLVFFIALGVGFYIAALNVKYRDFRFMVPFIVQFGLYISPVGFSSSVIPQKWRLLYSLNPMVGAIDGFRWAVLGQAFDGYTLLISVGMALLFMIVGVRYFRKAEKSFADII
jgi:lipopolysaccharide transport system permease protein